MTRKTIIAGNWKMFKTGSEAVDYIQEIGPLVASSDAEVLLAVPFTAINQSSKAASKKHLQVGAQNMFYEEKGAFTGEISAIMLKDAGAEFVIIGHSERRQFFHEDDAMINKKVLHAMKSDLRVILCVGESLAEKEDNKTDSVLRSQILNGLKGVPKNFTDFIIAYEPVWAIGTGVSATPEIAQKNHHFCRKVLAEQFSKNHAGKIPILYGGSVKADNIKKLMEQEDIDGALVGGASLDPSSFEKIVNY